MYWDSSHTAKIIVTSMIQLMTILPFIIISHKCVTGKYATHRIYMKLHLGPKWHIFHIVTNEDINIWLFVETVSLSTY